MAASRHTRRPALAVEHLWGLVTLAGVFIFINTHPIRPHDFWWHLKVGQTLHDTGVIPTQDVYSHTVPGAPYTYAIYWISELAFYRIYALGGPALIVFVQSLTITAAYGLIFVLCAARSRDWRIAGLCTLLAAALGIENWNVRPQTVAIPLFVIFQWVIWRYEQRRNWRWLLILPVGMLLWANSHGSFPLGLVQIGIWAAATGWRMIRARRLEHKAWSWKPLAGPVLMGLICTGVCLINPQGFGIVKYVTRIFGHQAVQHIVTEWAATSWSTLNGKLFFLALGLAGLTLIYSPRTPSFSQLAHLLGFAFLGLQSVRNVIWFGLVAAPVLADHLPGTLAGIGQTWRLTSSDPASGASKLHAALTYSLAGLVLVAVLFTLPWFKDYLGLPAEKAGLVSAETPVAATAYLQQAHLPGPIFNEMGFGSYLIWEASPDYPVFVDPRIDLYPATLWADYLKISSAQYDWENLLAKYNIQTLMLSPRNQPQLVEAAEISPGWQNVYADATTVFFIRTNP